MRSCLCSSVLAGCVASVVLSPCRFLISLTLLMYSGQARSLAMCSPLQFVQCAPHLFGQKNYKWFAARLMQQQYGRAEKACYPPLYRTRTIYLFSLQKHGDQKFCLIASPKSANDSTNMGIFFIFISASLSPTSRCFPCTLGTLVEALPVGLAPAGEVLVVLRWWCGGCCGSGRYVTVGEGGVLPATNYATIPEDASTSELAFLVAGRLELCSHCRSFGCFEILKLQKVHPRIGTIRWIIFI